MDMMWYRRRGLMTAPHIESVSGSVASFNSDYNKISVNSLICNIEPIQEGSGDPSPENVRPISGRTGVKVTRTGRNLFDQDNTSILSGNVRSYGFSDKLALQQINTLPAGTYTLSFSEEVVSLNGIEPVETRLGLYLRAVSNGAVLNVNAQSDLFMPSVGYKITKSVTFTLTEEYVGKFIYFYVYSGKNDASDAPNEYTAVFSNIQLELGSTATAYEPYKGSTYSVNWETEAGTVYGGTLDVVSGKLIITHKSFVFDGTNASFVKYDIAQGMLYRTSGLSDREFGQLPGLLFSDKFKAVLFANRSNLTVSAGAINTENIDFIFNDASTVAEWNDWLTQNNVMVCYKIATPTEIQLTPQEVRTLLGENNIWSDSGNVSVNYWKWGK